MDQIRWERRKKEGKKKKIKEKKVEGKWSEKFYIISKIYRDVAVGSSEQDAKFIYATRASRRYKNMGFFQTPRGRGFSHALVILGLRAI